LAEAEWQGAVWRVEAVEAGDAAEPRPQYGKARPRDR
jgi:hypothetical protein